MQWNNCLLQKKSFRIASAWCEKWYIFVSSDSGRWEHYEDQKTNWQNPWLALNDTSEKKEYCSKRGFHIKSSQRRECHSLLTRLSWQIMVGFDKCLKTSSFRCCYMLTQGKVWKRTTRELNFSRPSTWSAWVEGKSIGEYDNKSELYTDSKPFHQKWKFDLYIELR